MESLRRQASKLKEQVAKQQQVTLNSHLYIGIWLVFSLAARKFQ